MTTSYDVRGWTAIEMERSLVYVNVRLEPIAWRRGFDIPHGV